MSNPSRDDMIDFLSKTLAEKGLHPLDFLNGPFKDIIPKEVLMSFISDEEKEFHGVPNNIKPVDKIYDVTIDQKNIKTRLNGPKMTESPRRVIDYKLPEDATELQDLISFKNLNAQMGEIFRIVYYYEQSNHATKIQEAKRIRYYIEAEIKRLEKYDTK